MWHPINSDDINDLPRGASPLFSNLDSIRKKLVDPILRTVGSVAVAYAGKFSCSSRSPNFHRRNDHSLLSE